MDTAIEFKHVKKVYGEKVIIDDFNLKITPGEFLTVELVVQGVEKPLF